MPSHVLKRLDDIQHNWQRSQDHLKVLTEVGMGTSVKDVENIIDKLLDAGATVTVDATKKEFHNAEIDAPAKKLIVKTAGNEIPRAGTTWQPSCSSPRSDDDARPHLFNRC